MKICTLVLVWVINVMPMALFAESSHVESWVKRELESKWGEKHMQMAPSEKLAFLTERSKSSEDFAPGEITKALLSFE